MRVGCWCKGKAVAQERVRTSKGVALRWATIAVAVVLLVGVGVVMASRRGRSDLTRSAETASASRQDFEIVTTASGELEAKNRVELRSGLERQSLITFIVPEGARVKQGDLLVQLQTDQIKTELDEVFAQVVSARAQLVSATKAYEIQLNTNESRLRQARLAVDLARLAMSQWMEGDVAMKRQDNHLMISRAELELERLADKFARSQDLYEQGFSSKDEMDKDEVAYIEAISQWSTSRLSSEVYEKFDFPKDEKTKQSAVEESQAELERVVMNNESELASKLADKTNAEQQLTLKESKHARLSRQFESATVKAPQDGLVVYATSLERGGWGGRGDVTLQIGQQVSPNQLMIILPDTSEMVAAVRVQEALAGRIRPDMPASVRVDAAGGRVFNGHVESIGVIAETGGWRDPNLREYTVRIAMDIGDAAEKLKPSMRAESKITLGQATNALSVPVQGVFQDGAVRFVYRVRSDGQVERVPIKLGKRSDTRAEILVGLDEGQSVLVRDPMPGELVAGAWNPEQLKAAGYAIDEQGNPVAPREARPMGRPGGNGGAGGPAGAGATPGSPSAQPSGESGPPGGAPRDGSNPDRPRRQRGDRPSGSPPAGAAPPGGGAPPAGGGPSGGK